MYIAKTEILWATFSPYSVGIGLTLTTLT